MFNPSREEARQFFFDAWQHYQDKKPLTDLEAVTIDLLLQHPEYHHALQNQATLAERDFPPEHGETNPFLHLSLHLALQEQLSIDQPAGVRLAYKQLQTHFQDAHRAQHAMMECLAEMLWRAQRDHSSLDPSIYFDCIAQTLRA